MPKIQVLGNVNNSYSLPEKGVHYNQDVCTHVYVCRKCIIPFDAPKNSKVGFIINFTFINIRNIQTWKEFTRAQTVDNCRETESQQIEIMLWKMAVLHLVFINYNQKRRHKWVT